MSFVTRRVLAGARSTLARSSILAAPLCPRAHPLFARNLGPQAGPSLSRTFFTSPPVAARAKDKKKKKKAEKEKAKAKAKAAPVKKKKKVVVVKKRKTKELGGERLPLEDAIKVLRVRPTLDLGLPSDHRLPPSGC